MYSAENNFGINEPRTSVPHTISGIKHFGPFWSENHFLYGKERWILSRAYAFALSLLMIAMCYSPFHFAFDFFFFRALGSESNPEFPSSHEMAICDKISSVCFSAVLFSSWCCPTLTISIQDPQRERCLGCYEYCKYGASGRALYVNDSNSCAVVHIYSDPVGSGRIV